MRTHFILLILFVYFCLGQQDEEAIEIHLGSEELRGSMEWPSMRDRENSDDMGIFMTDFFDDSKSQVKS
jgi:hypothetical protein